MFWGSRGFYSPSNGPRVAPVFSAKFRDGATGISY